MIWIVFAILLFLLGAALLVAEVFVPSFGLLTVGAFAALIGGVYIFFTYSTLAGWLGIFIAVIMVPTVLIAAYRTLPKTRFGKNVILSQPKREKGEGVPDAPQLKELEGRVGVVLTPLRPVGMCDFSGLRVESVAESGYVNKGRKVKVIHIDGTQVTVRVVEENS
jgi:membrane-bound serine protease (ClpP class)